MSSRTRSAALAAVLIAAAAPAARAQQTGHAPLEIPLAPFGDGRGRVIRVAVAGDTLDFLLDTAGGVTAISPEVAGRLGCTPSGRSHGYRMTGEHFESRVCREVPLSIGAYHARVEASVMEIRPGPRPVHGMISLRTFAGRALTLDLAGQRLIVETPASLAARVAGMTPLQLRLATGLEGGMLDAYVGVPAGDATLWLLWDSGHRGRTFVAPWAARALGVPEGRGGAEVRMALAPGVEALLPVEEKEIIHDGVLSAGLLERATWTIDLATQRLWMGPLRPLLEAPPVAAAVLEPARDAAGWYDVTLVVDGDAQHSIVRVARAAGGLEGRMRFLGDDREFALRDVRAEGGRLTFGLPMRQTYPVHIAFQGRDGTGTWGDPAARGGAVRARKRG